MTVALQQHKQPSLVRSTSAARSEPRLVQRKQRENAKHSNLLGRLRLSYARRGSTPPAPTSTATAASSNSSSTLKKEAVPPPESSSSSSEGVENHQRAAQKKPKQLSQDSTSSIITTTTSSTPSIIASRPTVMLLPKNKQRLVKRFPPSPKSKGVLSGSLVGAKRGYVDLAPPSQEGGYYYCSDDEEDEDASMDSSSSEQSSSSSTDESASTRTRRRRLVHFAPSCLVTEIPHHSQYSLQQRRQQWNGRKAIRTRARINSFEYQHDGWELDKAAEEDAFCEFEGELYHPAHKYTHQYMRMMSSNSSTSTAEEQRE